MLTDNSNIILLFIITIVNKAICYNLVTPETPPLYHIVGSDVVLPCKVQGNDYNPFSDPLEFTKKQEHAEEKVVLVFESLKLPFETNTPNNRYSGRHTYSLPGAPVLEHSLNLTITELKVYDSGTYKCKVGESGNSIVHHLYVIDDVKDLNIYGYDGGSPLWNTLEPATGALDYDTSTPGMIQCVAIGAYPPPTLSIYIGDQQKTGDFDHNSTCSLSGPDVGLQRIQCNTTRGSQSFSPAADVTGETMSCTSHQHDLVPDRTASVQLNIKGLPHIIPEQCPNVVYARVKDESAVLSCVIVSNPAPTAVSWSVDFTQIDVTSNNPKDRFTAVNIILPGGKVEARLTITDVKRDDLHVYILKVINELGEMEERSIELQESSQTGRVSGGSNMSYSVLLYLTMLSLSLSLLRGTFV